MNATKHKNIFLVVIISILVVGAFSIVQVRAMNDRNSSIATIRIEGVAVGAAGIPNTLDVAIYFVSNDDTADFITIQVPATGSPREMNRNIREILEKSMFNGKPIVDAKDTLIVFGGPEKL
jgi:hypothetical protein